MDISTDRLVLGGLVLSDDFLRKTIPFFQEEYFQNLADRSVFKVIKRFIHEYKVPPSKTALMMEIRNEMGLSDSVCEDAVKIVDDIYTINVKDLDPKWLVKQAEEFCQSKAIYNAIIKSIAIYDGSDHELTPHAIPDMIKKAVGITFDTQIGKDIYDDAGARHDYYTAVENKIPFDIELLNTITNGGCPRKTLNVIAAGINAGKTLSLCHLAASYLKNGFDVLYITMEMCEEEILKRIDANILKMDMNCLKDMPREAFVSKLQKIKEKSHGRIKVKEFPPGGGTAAHFAHLLAELKLKQGFDPTIVIVDYIGIVGSSRMKMGVQSSYFYLKAVAEELRALAVEHEKVLWTALQLTRGGITSSDVDITDVAESMGIPATADLMLAVTRTEDLDDMGQVLWKQLKNRYGNKAKWLRFVTGVNLETQTLYDVNQDEQKDIVAVPKKSGPGGVSDTSKFRDKFSDFKV